jgi:hypothetical protein
MAFWMPVRRRWPEAEPRQTEGPHARQAAAPPGDEAARNIDY